VRQRQPFGDRVAFSGQFVERPLTPQQISRIAIDSWRMIAARRACRGRDRTP